MPATATRTAANLAEVTVFDLGDGWRVERAHTPSFGWGYCCYQMGRDGRVVPGTGRGGSLADRFSTKAQAIAAVDAQRAQEAA